MTRIRLMTIVLALPVIVLLVAACGNGGGY
jgi:hypothetical protein